MLAAHVKNNFAFVIWYFGARWLHYVLSRLYFRAIALALALDLTLTLTPITIQIPILIPTLILILILILIMFSSDKRVILLTREQI